jgi:hypothetical protein
MTKDKKEVECRGQVENEEEEERRGRGTIEKMEKKRGEILGRKNSTEGARGGRIKQYILGNTLSTNSSAKSSWKVILKL